MKKTAIWITAILLAVSLSGCSDSPEIILPEESEVVLQAEEPLTLENSSKVDDESGISFSDGESIPAEQEEISEEIAESATTASDNAPSATTPAPKQTPPAVSEPSKEPEQPAATPQQPTETPKPQETQPPTPTPTDAPAPTPTPTEPPQTFDVSQYISYAKSYGQGIGLSLDSTANACWDNPLIASTSSTTLERDIRDMLDWYKVDGNSYFWVWTESRSDGKYNLYIGYA